jgi:pyruvate dehydrogenase E1 component
MVPFYVYYSMFGFQRIGDLAWAAGDMQARGFLMGGTAGRTTLNGEGLQHEDGHSHIMSSLIPNCVSYDPTFGHELAVIIQHGMKRMVEDQENVFYYITIMNENYAHPGLKQGDEDGIIRGMYKLRSNGKDKDKLRVQLMGSGTILREVMAAQDMLMEDWGVMAWIASVSGYCIPSARICLLPM